MSPLLAPPTTAEIVQRLNDRALGNDRLSFFSDPSRGDLIFARLRIPGTQASAIVCLMGAHLVSVTRADGAELLFLSDTCKWKEGVAIRGGVPLVFGWFGGRKGDSMFTHGYGRIITWGLKNCTCSGDQTRLILEADQSAFRDVAALRDDPATSKIRFRAEIEIILSPNGIDQRARVWTTGPFQGGFHSYFRVANPQEIQIQGLDGHRYIDAFDSRREKSPHPGPLVPGKEGVNQIFFPTPGMSLAQQAALLDPGLHRRIEVEAQGTKNWVGWVPPADFLARAEFAPLHADLSGTGFFCLEAVDALEAHELNEATPHEFAQQIRVRPT